MAQIMNQQEDLRVVSMSFDICNSYSTPSLVSFLKESLNENLTNISIALNVRLTSLSIIGFIAFTYLKYMLGVSRTWLSKFNFFSQLNSYRLEMVFNSRMA